MRTITAHFDGRALVPDSPLDLPVGEKVELFIRQPAQPPVDKPGPKFRDFEPIKVGGKPASEMLIEDRE